MAEPESLLVGRICAHKGVLVAAFCNHNFLATFASIGRREGDIPWQNED